MGKQIKCLLMGLLSVLALQLPLSWVASSAIAAPAKVLVLYDAPVGQPFSRIGLAYAIMLRNLLGHFDTAVDMVPVQNYTAGKVEAYQSTFYVGAYYDNPVPKALLTDVGTTQKTVVWFKYNIWQMAWDPAYNFSSKFGFSFLGLRGLDTQPTVAQPNVGFYDTVLYKDKELKKYYAFNAAAGIANADPEFGLTQITDAAKAQQIVPIKNSATQAQAPYVIRSGNFWYFADLPFSYIGPRDRYLVLCDLLHDMLGATLPAKRNALVRLEDVSVLTSSTAMKTLIDYMKSKTIPFSVALIPFYRDPLGAYNNGVAQEVHLKNATALKASLNYALANGGKLVMHGYTHQYNSMKNIHTGVSGDDYEFWDAVNNKPVPEDSTAWAGGRLDAGLLEFKENGYTPFAWEAPHYHSSPLSIRAVPARFSKTYQRVVYYTSDKADLYNANSAERDFMVGQFFPYTINVDYYGQKVLPENLGNIEYDICETDSSSCYNYSWSDLLTNAQYATVVRDGVASFFFHPFWLEAAVGKPGFADFKSLVEGITALGYTWTDASTM